MPSFGKMRDPTAPPSVSMGIKAIRITNNQGEVLVGSGSLKVGDELMGAKIVKIMPHAVELREKGRVFSVSVFNPLKKEPVSKVKKES